MSSLRSALAGSAFLVIFAPLAFAQTQAVVQIGNGTATPNGSYLNATNIADTLAFTNVNVMATSAIEYVDAVNLGSTTQFGPALFTLFNTAPITSIGNNILWDSFNADERFSINSAQVNLSGAFTDYSSGALIGASQLTGDATTVSVLSNAANLQQALDFTQTASSPATVIATLGTASSLSFNEDTKMVLSGGLLSGTVAMNDADASLVLEGSGFELNTGSGFHPVGGAIGATSGQLEGVLDSGNSFTISFTQSAPGQISVVPLPASVWMLLGALSGFGAMIRRRTS